MAFFRSGHHGQIRALGLPTGVEASGYQQLVAEDRATGMLLATCPAVSGVQSIPAGVGSGQRVAAADDLARSRRPPKLFA